MFSAGARLRDCARATLLLPLVLLGCSGVALTQTDAPTSAPNPAAFHKIIGDYLKKSFKEIATSRVSRYRTRAGCTRSKAGAG